MRARVMSMVVGVLAACTVAGPAMAEVSVIKGAATCVASARRGFSLKMVNLELWGRFDFSAPGGEGALGGRVGLVELRRDGAVVGRLARSDRLKGTVGMSAKGAYYGTKVKVGRYEVDITVNPQGTVEACLLSPRYIPIATRCSVKGFNLK